MGEATTSYPASRKTCSRPTEASSQITDLPGSGSIGTVAVPLVGKIVGLVIVISHVPVMPSHFVAVKWSPAESPSTRRSPM